MKRQVSTDDTKKQVGLFEDILTHILYNRIQLFCSVRQAYTDTTQQLTTFSLCLIEHEDNMGCAKTLTILFFFRGWGGGYG